MNKIILTWGDIELQTNDLAEQLKYSRFDGIIAVTKGGMIPAALLAKKLGIDLIETVCIKSYTADNNREQIELIKMTPYPERNWLIVDDLVDSGNSFRYLRKYLPNSMYAVLYAKPHGMSHTDYYSMEMAQEEWLVFPWE